MKLKVKTSLSYSRFKSFQIISYIRKDLNLEKEEADEERVTEMTSKLSCQGDSLGEIVKH